MPNPPDNPYVGPRTFRADEGDRFFGREREVRDLLALVVSKRLVLFYAQSGAGKSSLIRARLIPRLTEEEGFVVLPIGSISGDLPPGIGRVDNVFLFNLYLSLVGRDQSDPERLAHTDELTLTRFLTDLATMDGENYYYDDTPSDDEEEEFSYGAPPHVLIIDQFEEIATTHLDRWPDRQEFFRQLGQAMMDDPLLWVVLTLREDYVAALDPYAHLVPDRMQARFYMQRMDREAALQAIMLPAKEIGNLPFASEAADKLASDLRRIRIHGRQEMIPGQFVEPFQLSVVCWQLWNSLESKEEKEEIQVGDIDALAGGEDWGPFISQALAQCYEQTLSEALEHTSVSERELRDWIQEKLITKAKTRGMVGQGDAATQRIGQAVTVLIDGFIVHPVSRAAGNWYELAHDRLVEPILESNRAWYARHQNPLTLAAQEWLAADQDPQKLYRGRQLEEAQAQVETNPNEFTALEKEFVRVGLEAARRQVTRRQRLALLITLVLLVLFATLAALSIRNARDASQQSAVTEALWLAFATTENVSANRELSVLLAIQALLGAEDAADPAVTTEAKNALDQALQQVFVHTDLVKDIAFSPDGKYVATASADRTAQIWDAASGGQRLILKGHDDAVLGVTFSSSGEYLATASVDGTAKIWDVASGGGVATCTGHTGAVLGVTLSPDGTRVATASADGTVRIWDAHTCDPLFVLTDFADQVLDVAFGSDGKYLAAAGVHGTVLVWDAIAREPVIAFRQHAGPVLRVAFSPDGTRLATAGADGTVEVWDVSSWEPMLKLSGHGDQVLDIAFSPDGRHLATASEDGTAKVWELSSGAALYTFSSHRDSVNGVAFSPDGRRVATASSDRTARVSAQDMHTLGTEQLLALACQHTTRNLARDEWERYMRARGAYAPTCPGLPVHPSVILEHVRRGERERAIALSSEQLAASAFIDLGRDYASQGKYEEAVAALDQGVSLDPGLEISQTTVIASAYGSVCALSRSGEFQEEDVPSAILEACAQAVALAVRTADFPLNSSLCENGEIASLAETVSPACARAEEILVPSEGVTRYIFGLHEPGGEWLMAEKGKRGWILFTHGLGHDPAEQSSMDYREWSDRGFGIIGRLNHGYGPAGTIPLPQYYDAFALRVRNFVSNSHGCHIWVIGNEMNHGQERPEGQAITPDRYAAAYKQVWEQIHSLPDHKDDQVIVGPVAPWINTTPYPGNGSGDWVRYFRDTLNAIRALDCPVDGIALHTRTHGQDPQLVLSDQKMYPPFDDYHYHFRAYRDFMDAIPQDLRHVPVYITETYQDEPWENANRGWIQNAYQEIHNWNTTPGHQQIRALILYRWPKFDKWNIEGKGGVHDDFRAAMDHEYVWISKE